MDQSSKKIYLDFDVGTFTGNIFCLLADKFPVNVRNTILDTYSVVLECRISIRRATKTNHIGYRIEYQKEKYDEIKHILDLIYKDIPKIEGYDYVYNSGHIDSQYPNIHNHNDGTLVVWFSLMSIGATN